MRCSIIKGRKPPVTAVGHICRSIRRFALAVPPRCLREPRVLPVAPPGLLAGRVMDGGEGCVWNAPPRRQEAARPWPALPSCVRGGTEREKPWLPLALRKVLPFQLDYSKNMLIFHKIIISFLSKYSYSGSDASIMK